MGCPVRSDSVSVSGNQGNGSAERDRERRVWHMGNKDQSRNRDICFWVLVWGLGIAGQLCWNMENQWFNTFVYAKIGGDVNIVTAMVIVSAIVTTISTFVFGTLSDRMGKRKRFVSLGYIFWGVSTILFGMTEYARNSGVAWLIAISGPMVVIADAI